MMNASRTTARLAAQAARTTTRRSYATAERPPLAHGGSNRNVVIGLTTVSVTALGYFYMREASPGNNNNRAGAIADGQDGTPFSKADPRRPKTREERQREGQHPEDMDDKYRAPFGVRHAQKRVDEPPSNRNHQEMQNLSKLNAKQE